MAFVGLRHPVWAPIENETDGTMPVYGKGVVVGHAMTADVAFKRSEQTLYGDDTGIDSDNTITGGTVTLGTDDISDEAAMAMLGERKTEDGEIVEGGGQAPYGGFGYVRVCRVGGKTSYIAYWIYKTQFGRGDENAKTRGETLEWQTPTVKGSMMGAYVDDSGEPSIRMRRRFDKPAEAIAWVDSLGGIGSSEDGQTVSSADGQTGE